MISRFSLAGSKAERYILYIHIYIYIERAGHFLVVDNSNSKAKYRPERKNGAHIVRSGSIAPFTICFPALDNAAVEFPLLVSCNLTRRSANWLAVHFLYHCGHCGLSEASYSFAAVSASSKQKQDA